MILKVSINKIIEILIGLLILFYFFNSVTISNVKVFYLLIPPIIILFSLLNRVTFNKENKLGILFVLFAILSLIPAIMTNNEAVIKNSVRNLLSLALIILICWVLSNIIIQIKSMSYFSNISIITAVVLLYSLIHSLGGGRFEGYFNDPNYLSSAIILLEFLIIINMHFVSKNIRKHKRALSILAIIILNITILYTASRSGILSISLFNIFYFFYLYRKSKSKMLLVLSVLLGLTILFLIVYKFFNTQLLYVSERFFAEQGSNDYNSSLMRINEIKSGFNMMSDNILSLFVGTGIGSTNSKEYFSQYTEYAYLGSTRVHNSYMAIFIEQGIFSILIFLALLISIYKNIKRFAGEYKLIIYGLFLSQLLISSFIWNINFLPFWMSLYIASSFSRRVNKYSKSNQN